MYGFLLFFMLSFMSFQSAEAAMSCPDLIKNAMESVRRKVDAVVHYRSPLERSFFYRGFSGPPLRLSKRHKELIFQRKEELKYRHSVYDMDGPELSSLIVENWKLPKELGENLQKLKKEADLMNWGRLKMDWTEGVDLRQNIQTLEEILRKALEPQHSSPDRKTAGRYSGSGSPDRSSSKFPDEKKSLEQLLAEVSFILKIPKDALDHRYSKNNIVPPYQKLYEGLYDPKWLVDQPLEPRIDFVMVNKEKYNPSDPKVKELVQSRLELSRRSMELYLDAGLEGWPPEKFHKKLEALLDKYR